MLTPEIVFLTQYATARLNEALGTQLTGRVARPDDLQVDRRARRQRATRGVWRRMRNAFRVSSNRPGVGSKAS